jgi:hypothetical protein
MQHISKKSRLVAVPLLLSYLAMSIVVSAHFHPAHAGDVVFDSAATNDGAHAGVHGENSCHVAWYAASAFIGLPTPLSPPLPPFSRSTFLAPADNGYALPCAFHHTIRGPPGA